MVILVGAELSTNGIGWFGLIFGVGASNELHGRRQLIGGAFYGMYGALVVMAMVDDVEAA